MQNNPVGDDSHYGILLDPLAQEKTLPGEISVAATQVERAIGPNLTNTATSWIEYVTISD